jgi:hypothetical protein
MQIPDLVVKGAGAHGDAAIGILHPKKLLHQHRSTMAREAQRTADKPAISTKESLDKRGLSGGIEQKREPLAVNYL